MSMLHLTGRIHINIDVCIFISVLCVCLGARCVCIEAPSCTQVLLDVCTQRCLSVTYAHSSNYRVYKNRYEYRYPTFKQHNTNAKIHTLNRTVTVYS